MIERQSCWCNSYLYCSVERKVNHPLNVLIPVNLVVLVRNRFLESLYELCYLRTGILNLDFGVFLWVFCWNVSLYVPFFVSFSAFIWYVLSALSCIVYCYYYYYYHLGYFTDATNYFNFAQLSDTLIEHNLTNYLFVQSYFSLLEVYIQGYFFIS